MSKRSMNRWAALLGIGLLAGCAAPSTSVSGGCASGMAPDTSQQPGAMQEQPGALQQQPGAMQEQPGITQQPTGALAAVNAVDQQFVMDVGQGNNAEIALSQLALQKASADAVKQFAQRMVTDHTQAGQQLQQAASQAGLTVPQDVKPEDQATAQQLSALSGPAFDQAYMAKMVADHEKTVTAFQNEISNGQNPAIKGFAQQTLPTIQDHLRQAREVAGGLQAAPTS